MEGGAITGVVGAIYWRHAKVAAVDEYTVLCTKHSGAWQWSLRARLTAVDPYAVTQTPLLFIAPMAAGAACWPIRTFARTGAWVTAEHGPLVES